jgi:hypoxanthine phosphoribosyltransferase
MTTNPSLTSSIPANNVKIIEIYNKLRSEQLIVNKDYQRKLVWKKAHKINFIETILQNYPFPEVYLAPGELDQVKLILIDEIVDGQQRLSTIKDYIEDKDVFALPKLNIKKFSQLEPEERNSFLNYEVSIRYLKNINKEQIRDIFQRINKTEYSLNSMERTNAQWGDSEFICFCKQLVETELSTSTFEYVIPDQDRKNIQYFFHGTNDDDDGVFSESDMSRMFALQYVMTLVATMHSQQYFTRTDRLKFYIEHFNEAFPDASSLKDRLLKVISFLNALSIQRNTRWYNKANLFTIMVELDKTSIQEINNQCFSEKLNELDIKASNLEQGAQVQGLTPEEIRYFGYAREAVNQKVAREYRGKFMNEVLLSCRN